MEKTKELLKQYAKSPSTEEIQNSLFEIIKNKVFETINKEIDKLSSVFLKDKFEAGLNLEDVLNLIKSGPNGFEYVTSFEFLLPKSKFNNEFYKEKINQSINLWLEKKSVETTGVLNQVVINHGLLKIGFHKNMFDTVFSPNKIGVSVYMEFKMSTDAFASMINKLVAVSEQEVIKEELHPLSKSLKPKTL